MSGKGERFRKTGKTNFVWIGFIPILLSGYFLVLGFLLPAGCSGPDKNGATTARPAEERPSVEILTEEGRRVVYSVELARTDAERRQGLMGRSQLDADAGMLFLFPTEHIQTFWMKDTPISLDMIFINAKMEVAGVSKRTRPLDTSSYYVRRPSRYVLEVNAGQAETWGIGPGARVIFHGIP